MLGFATIAVKVLAGLVVGTLVGLTGLGGGMVLLPVLIYFLGVPPIVAVGSDAVINCVTKIGAGSVHWSRGNVDAALILSLVCGSIPGAMIGVALLNSLHATYGDGANVFLRAVIGALLLLIPIGYLINVRSSQSGEAPSKLSQGKFLPGATLIGLGAGLLVGMTSIGSGSVILLFLLVIYGLPPATMVGTDVVHAVLLSGVAAALQFKLGNVDLKLVFWVLLGSVPGGILGAFLANHVPSARLKPILCTLLMVVGARMLWGTLLHAN